MHDDLHTFTDAVVAYAEQVKTHPYAHAQHAQISFGTIEGDKGYKLYADKDSWCLYHGTASIDCCVRRATPLGNFQAAVQRLVTLKTHS